METETDERFEDIEGVPNTEHYITLGRGGYGERNPTKAF
jgi:hypothetical protein